jgi:hypothetical protein
VATQDDVRRICLALADTTEDDNGFRFFVAGKQFVWSWMERVEQKRPRVANPEVIAVRTADETAKQDLLALDRDVFFTEPHYDGYPAVLVRLPPIEPELLTVVLTDAWRSRAAKSRHRR